MKKCRRHQFWIIFSMQFKNRDLARLARLIPDPALCRGRNRISDQYQMWFLPFTKVSGGSIAGCGDNFETCSLKHPFSNIGQAGIMRNYQDLCRQLLFLVDSFFHLWWQCASCGNANTGYLQRFNGRDTHHTSWRGIT